jgi:signal transduction histidine kinase
MSIRLRLTLYWAAVLGGILIVAALAAFKLFERQQWGALDAALFEEADTSADSISRAGVDRARSVVWQLSQERDLGPRRRVRLVTPSGVVADFGDQHAAAPELKLSGGFRGTINGRDHIFRFAIMPLRFQQAPAVLEDGVDATPVREAIGRLRAALLLTVPLVLLLCVAGGYLLAGRALAPIASIADELAAIEPRDLSRRLATPAAEDEVARLTAAINALLDRVARASATERRFASDAAHELRTPLAVLRTGLEVALARERDAAANRAALDDAHREVVALCKVADELLALARLGGEVTIDRKPLDLAALIREVGEQVEPLATAKGIALVTDAPASAMVDGNESHLRRAVINLLDNALKHTPEGGSVALSLRRDGALARLSVADTGAGIDPAELEHIFERFFRGRRAAGDGAGLGLSLVSEVARLHGGTVSARNRDTGGCEFIVTVPLSRARAREASGAA